MTATVIGKKLPRIQRLWNTFLTRTMAMSGGFLFLLIETRFEHRSVLPADWRPWIPIIISGAMVALIPFAGIFWTKGGKRVLTIVYLMTVAMGMMGVYFHSEGRLLERVAELLQIWMVSLDDGSRIAASHPPVLAPLAFVGLGILGLLSCLGDSKNSRQGDDSKCQTEKGR